MAIYKNRILYYTPNLDINRYVSLLKQEGISLKKINPHSIEDLKSQESLKVLLIDYEYLNTLNAETIEKVFFPNYLNINMLINGHENSNYFKDDDIFAYINTPIKEREFVKAIKSGFFHLQLKSECESLRSEINLRTTELKDLNRIEMSSSSERDFAKILKLILSKSIEITNCDAGSLYLSEVAKDNKNKLVFQLVHNDTLSKSSFKDCTVSTDNTSVAGYVASTGKFVNLKDAYNIPGNVEYQFNKAFDKKNNYRTKSMLTIPIKGQDDDIIGVLQLINRKKSINTKLTSRKIIDAEVIPFDEDCIRLINSLSSQAVVSIRNSLLSGAIQKMYKLKDLNRIGLSFSTEQNYDKLLKLILSNCKALTCSDAGSLYLLEDTKEGEKKLVFKLAQNDTLPDLPFNEYALPLTKKSIAGYVMLTAQLVNLADVYNIPEKAEYTFNQDFDKRFNYRTKSMLAIPMIGHGNKIVGVLELINRKRSISTKLASSKIMDAEVIPFDNKSIDLVNIAANHAALSIENNIWSQAVQRIFELSDLNKIGIALSAEQNYERLLALILTKCREITNCDAGSLYLLRKNNEEELVFKLAQNDTLNNLSFNEDTLPLTKKSIAGYVAMTGNVVKLEDVYNIPKQEEYSYNGHFDKKLNYRTKSMLILPMKDHKDKIIGVMQLINAKKSRDIKLTSDRIVDSEVISFDERFIDMLKSLTSQAAVSIENNLLYQNIENLFKGFVKASIHAIEQRDPTTYGHSERVTAMTVRLAEIIDKTTEGKFKNIHFSKHQIREIRYAGLLHDFGKVGVREHVLVKAKKMYPHNLEIVKNRFGFIKRSIECKYLEKKIDLLCNKNVDDNSDYLSKIDKEQENALNEIDNYFEHIVKTNEPTILEEDQIKKITEIASKTYLDLNGEELRYLTPLETSYLSIKKGSLNDKEIREIQSHSEHTYEFLRKIHWTKELAQIPNIAYAHHEALNGTGYPLGIKDKQIPLQSKMIAIADIYDALTANDRPYKKAVSHEKALAIISYEVKDSRLDSDLFDIFVQEKVYEIATKLASKAQMPDNLS